MTDAAASKPAANPLLALPSMLIMAAVLYYLARSIRELTGLKLTDLLHDAKD